MHPFKKMIFRLVLSSETTPPPNEIATLQHYMRDGSQVEGTSFHLPYIKYIDENGNLSIFYADKDFDICGSFMARSITSIYYCIECVY